MENSKETPKETPKEKASKLGWLGEGKKEPNGKSPGLPDLSTVLVVGVISLVMALLVVFLIAPTKGSLQTLRGELDTRFSTASYALDTKLANYQTAVTGEISNLKSRVDSFSSQLSSLDSRISGLSGLEGRVNTAISKIDNKVSSTVTTKMADLEARVAALEETKEEIATSSEGLTVEASTFAGMPLTFTGIPDDVEKLVATVGIKVTNATSEDADVGQLVLIISANQVFPSFAADSKPRLSGTLLNWTLVSGATGGTNYLVFVSNTGWSGFGQLTVDAGKSKMFYPQLYLRAAADKATTVAYYLSTEVEFAD